MTSITKFLKKLFQDEIWGRPAKEDIGVASFMSKHGMIMKLDKESREEFYFINKSIYESLDK